MKVIIVDDAMVMRQTLSEVLGADGIEVVASVPDAPTAFEAAAEYRPDVAIIDLRLPGQAGDKLAAELLESHLVDYVVMMSVDSSSDAHQRATCAGAVLFIDKCHDTSTLGGELRKLEASVAPVQILPLLECATLIREQIRKQDRAAHHVRRPIFWLLRCW